VIGVWFRRKRREARHARQAPAAQCCPPEIYAVCCLSSADDSPRPGARNVTENTYMPSVLTYGWGPDDGRDTRPPHGQF
jgi:hypothetical protein